MAERDVSVEDVEREHLSSTHEGAHWAYVAGVLGFGFLAMLIFIAFLGSGA